MTVTLNQAGIQALFADPTGPVGREVGRLAQELTVVAQGNVNEIMHRNPVVDIGFNLQEGPEGIQAVIGVVDGGSASDYIDEKAAAPKEGTESWMLRAMRTVFP